MRGQVERDSEQQPRWPKVTSSIDNQLPDGNNKAKCATSTLKGKQRK
jgi:hypothetical protein